jgi:hypothetical protein
MTKRAMWLPLGLIAAVAVGLTGLFASDAQAGGGSAVFTISSGNAAPNGTVDITVSVAPTGVSGVGAFQIDIVDDALVSATSCTATIGVVCNAAFAADTVRVTGAATPPGFTGTLATITYTAGATEGTSTLAGTVDTASCTDPDTNPITCTDVDGSITIQQATPTPTPSPTPAGGTATPTPAGGTATPVGQTPSPTPAGLPPTGGDSASSTLPVLLAGMGILALSAGAWAVSRLRVRA